MENINFILIETFLLSLTFFLIYINTYNYETKAGRFLYEAENTKEFFEILFKNIIKDFYPLSIPMLIGIFIIFIFAPSGFVLFLSGFLNNAGKILAIVITVLFAIFKLFKLYLYEKPVYRFIYENEQIKEVYENPVLSKFVGKKYLERVVERFLESAKSKKSTLAELEIKIGKLPILNGFYYAGLSAKVYIFKIEKDKKIRDCYDEYYLSGIMKN